MVEERKRGKQHRSGAEMRKSGKNERKGNDAMALHRRHPFNKIAVLLNFWNSSPHTVCQNNKMIHQDEYLRLNTLERCAIQVMT